MTDRPIISFQGVTKTFGKFTALNDVTFDVQLGESVALWGSNGAGKTTLIRCMLGVTTFAGSAFVEGIDSKRNGKDVRKKVGYVPQVMPLFDLPVGEMVLLITRLRGVTPTEGLNLLRRFELDHTRHQPVRSLSGGMRQKLALTLALLGDPHLLVFDEPTANLDAATQKELIGMLNDLKQEGRTIVFTSHRWSEVRAIADTVVHLEKGKVVEHGSVTSLAPELDQISLRIELAADQIQPAADALRALGFTPFVNTSNIVVSVQDRAKMEAFAALHESGIVPLNFDLEVEE